MSRLKFIITCHTGFEEYSEIEAKRLGVDLVERREGRIIVEGREESIYTLNKFGRTFHKVIILLKRDVARNLSEIYSKVRSLDFSFIKPDQKFAVRSERSGVHDFTSIDIAREAGRAVIDSYMADRGVRLGVDLDNPDVVITVDLIGSDLFIGVDTTGESLHIREYRRYNHPSAIKPSLASALIIMSGWRGEPLLDPFTGGATIPIEAALMAKARPVHENKDYLFRKLSFYSREEEETVTLKPPISPFPVDKIVAIEKKRKHFKGALKNVRTAEVSDLVNLILDDCLKYKPEEPFSFIVTNPPYGIRSGRKDKVQILYKLFLDKVPRLLKEGGRLVIITTEHKPMKEIIEDRGLKILKENLGRHGKLWVKAFLIEV